MCVTVLDGGLATQLEAMGHRLDSHLWSAALLEASPSAIREAHQAFFQAGAHVATTATYQASHGGLLAANVTDPEQAMVLAVRLAREAAELLPPSSALVAASLGPFGACLADGSEYSGHYRSWKVPDRDHSSLVAQLVDAGPPWSSPAQSIALEAIEAVKRMPFADALDLSATSWLASFHGPRVAAVSTGSPDVLALETMPCAVDAIAIAAVAAAGAKLGINPPAWVSFAVRDDGKQLVSGEPLDSTVQAVEAVFRAAGAPSALLAVGVNCCHPAAVLPALRTLLPQPESEARGPEQPEQPFLAATHALAKALAERGPYVRRVLVYPNSGELWDGVNKCWVNVERAAPEEGAGAGPGGTTTTTITMTETPAPPTPTEAKWGELATAWVKAGASGIGGCCRAGPKVIAQIASVLE